MTVRLTPMVPETLRRVLARLPAHLLTRDEETGGELGALLTAVAGELELLETDIQNLYDAWFVETCADWVLPYLADLVGLAELPPDLGPGTSRRALVANTVAHRRRKGTPAVLGQVTREVTGWPARVVEYFQLLVTSTHLNHVRLDRPASASVRNTDALRLAALDHSASTTLAGSLNSLAHTAEVRRIATGRGRYGIRNIGIFVYPIRVYEVGAKGWSQARRSGDAFTVDPLGRLAPLFAQPVTNHGTSGVECPATEAELPVPLRPHRLLALLKAARSGALDPAALPIGVQVGAADPLPPATIRACGLEDLDADPANAVQAMVDPIAGRLTLYRRGQLYRPTTRVFVRYAYGGLGDIGAGTYDRSAVHQQILESDYYDGRAGVTGQVAVLTTSASGVGSLADGLERLPSATGGTYVISIGNNARYDGELRVNIPAKTRLVLVAADGPGQMTALDGVPLRPGATYLPEGLRPHIVGNLTITGGPGSSMVLDGVLLEGDLVVERGHLGALTVSQSTLTGRVSVDGAPGQPNGDLRVRVVRSVLSGIELAPTVPALAVTDSIVNGGLPGMLPRTRARRAVMRAAGRATVSASGTHARFEGSTVRGEVAVRSLDANSCLFDGPVTVAHRQIGCLRFSYAGPGSRTPRRFRCVPTEASGAGPAPVYAADKPGAPDYLALASTCPTAIRTGGEGEAEMGVHHHLRRPLRVAAAARQLAPYLPFGLEIGIFGS